MNLLSAVRFLQRRTPVAAATGPTTTDIDWLCRGTSFRKLIDRLGPTEFRRRLLHMTPALLPLPLQWIPHQDVWEPPLITAMCVCMVIGLAIAIHVGPIVMRSCDECWMRSVLGYIVPVFAGLLLFPGRGELGLMTLEIIALGDGSATFGGKLFGGTRLPWNQRKTFSGLLCFLVAGSMAATFVYFGEAVPVVPVRSAFIVCGFATLCAAVVESLPIRSNDNLRVGTTALLAGSLISSLL